MTTLGSFHGRVDALRQLLAGLLLACLTPMAISQGAAMPATPAQAWVIQPEIWLDTEGRATAEQVIARTEGWKPYLGTLDLPRGGMASAWLRFRPAPGGNGLLYFETQYPSTDHVDLYEPQPDGSWRVQRSGDKVAPAAWPVHDRLPVLKITHPDPERIYLVRVRNATAMKIGARWLSQEELGETRKLVYLLMGAYLGLGGLALLAAVATSWVYRDRAMGVYALYVLGMMFTQAASQGFAGQYLWDESPAWNHAARLVLTWITVGLGVWTTLEVADLATLNPPMRRWMIGLALVQMVLAPASAWVLEQYALVAMNVAALGSMLICLWVLVYAHRRGNRHALGTALAFLPILVGSLVPIFRNLDLVPNIGVIAQFSFAAGAAIEIPLLLWVLLRRSRDLREFEAVDAARATTDKLTGLANAETALQRLEQTTVRARRYGQQAALLVFDLANLETIQTRYGRDAAETALVEVARRLRPVTRDVDTLARLRGGRFALIAEGPLEQQQITDMATRIIARGLVLPSPLPEQTTLQFSVVVAPVDPASRSSRSLADRAQDMLDRAPAQSTKAIRWLDDPDSTLVPLAA